MAPTTTTEPRAVPSRASERGRSEFRRNPLEAFAAVRQATHRLCTSLEHDDYGLQSMEGASPAKWHLAHTTWFFETFVLAPALPGYAVFHDRFSYLFNSYYETVGQMHPRSERGLLSRPTVPEVYRYREHVDAGITRLLERDDLSADLLAVLELGLHHEQQHQELLLTDLKHAFSRNPLLPALQQAKPKGNATAPKAIWIDHTGGVARVGHGGTAGGKTADRDASFFFDNEGPTHRVFLEPFGLQSRLVTCGEYLEFMADGGYTRPELWLSDGWADVQARQWNAPLYWQQSDGEWFQFTLRGLESVDPHLPVCHVSLYEADAYARWTGFRLPTEFEWEVSCRDLPLGGNFVESGELHPRTARQDAGLQQAYGDVWEWTGSAYAPYPAYRAPSGALGEYNGKFMCSQIVLRGGSCVTPASHIRPTYRNFFYHRDRWQFSGFRLARDV